MSVYTPDKWVILELKTPEETTYKILGSWYGGFADGDSWRASSGITGVTPTDHGYEFKNHSGSVYKCHKDGYGMSMHTHSILDYWQGQQVEGVSIRALSEDEAREFKI